MEDWIGLLFVAAIFFFQFIVAFRRNIQKKQQQQKQQSSISRKEKATPPHKRQWQSLPPPLPSLIEESEVSNTSPLREMTSVLRGKGLLADRKLLRQTLLIGEVLAPPRALKPYRTQF